MVRGKNYFTRIGSMGEKKFRGVLEMASIIVMTGAHAGDFYPLGHRPNVIGRQESLPIQILDECVSRKHMQIHFDSERRRYYAVDLKSKHGVFVNGRKIAEETPLAEGDEIRLGNVVLLFTEQDFADRESAMSHFKKVGERFRTTLGDQAVNRGRPD